MLVEEGTDEVIMYCFTYVESVSWAQNIYIHIRQGKLCFLSTMHIIISKLMDHNSIISAKNIYAPGGMNVYDVIIL